MIKTANMGIKSFFSKRIAFPSELRQKGVLAINRRNAEYVLPLNPRQYYPRVDDKLLTKTLCHPLGLPVPETFTAVSDFGQIDDVQTILLSRPEFVVKPASGAGGRGVLVIVDNEEGTFIKSDGTRLIFQDIRYHISTILSGLYSLGGQRDKAIIEHRIKPHPVFDSIAVQGTPDIRVIVYKGIPALAMLRLPTALSGGRANLHQGAVAAGIILKTGLTNGGVWKNQAISKHPETGQSIVGVNVPFWDIIIDSSIRLYNALELAYFGVDFVLDIDSGPVLLEANARPGLAIQIANRIGLLHRLRFIDSHVLPNMPLAEKKKLVELVSDIR